MVSTHSRLMALPPELRLIIYEYTLTDEHTITMRLHRNSHDNEPALLLTSTVVRHEARALYYKLNHFQVKLDLDEASLAATWLATICTQLGPRAFGKLQFRLTPPFEWIQIPSIMPILHLDSNGTIDLNLGLIKKRGNNPLSTNDQIMEWLWRKPDRESLFVVDDQGHGAAMFQRALEDVTLILYKARLFRWSERRLREEMWAVHRESIRVSSTTGSVRATRMARAEKRRLRERYDEYYSE